MEKVKSLLSYLTEHKRQVLIAAIGGAALILAFILASKRLFPTWIVLPMAIMMAVIAAPEFSSKVKIPDVARHITSVMFTAMIADIIMQCLTTNVYLAVWSPKYLINYAIYCFIIAVVTALLPSMFSGLLASNILLFIWSVLNFYLVIFRNRVFYLADLLSVRTAMAVADGYTFKLTTQLVRCSILFILAAAFTLIVFFRSDSAKYKVKPLVRYGIDGAAIILAVVTLLLGIPTKLGCTDIRQVTQTKYYMYSFFTAISSSRDNKPEGYSAEAVQQLALDYHSDPIDDFEIDKAPNVIVIMNESFADLNVLGEVNTNIEVMPFVSSLTDNAVRGYTYSSVFGGNTANSEFEFLTGDTMDFIPDGFVPYNTYINNYCPSVVSQFNSLGYKTISSHAYLPKSWSRVYVYKSFGFDQSLFMYDYTDPEYMRGAVSDSSNYKNLIEQFESKEDGEKVFLFNITIQNHGGYRRAYEGLEHSVTLTDYPDQFPQAEQYLSLAHESDIAVQELVEYFSAVDEPTVICFFGDHQPQLENEFYTAIFGKDESELTQEEFERKYMSPFFIWANYDIEEQYVDKISLNYLSTLLFKTVGLPMTGYQHLLDATFAEYPVITGVGVVDKDDTYYLHGTEPNDEFMKRYRIAAYNQLFGGRGRSDDLFELQGSPQPAEN